MTLLPQFENNIEMLTNLFVYMIKEDHYGIVPGHVEDPPDDLVRREA